jgi:PadR family transcriptional regulator
LDSTPLALGCPPSGTWNTDSGRCRKLLTERDDIFYIVSMQSRRNKTPDPLGEFESLVLLAVLRLGDDAYGMRIHEELESRARRRPSYGALYTTLERLEQKGYVSSWIGEPTPERGGRAKKYFKVDNMGKAALRQSYGATRRMADGIEALLGGESW